MWTRNYYRPQRSWGKVTFSQVSVILFTGGSASVHTGIPPTPPRTRHPPGPGTPQSRHPHPHPSSGSGTPPPQEQQSILGDTVNERAVCILLECNLVWCTCTRHLKAFWVWSWLSDMIHTITGIISIFRQKTEVNEAHFYVSAVSYPTISHTIVCGRREELTTAHKI